jgi:predicted Ser/Thr protein kinase
MSDACELIIDDYISGALNVTDLDEGLASLFVAMPSCHVAAQSHLQWLFATDKIDAIHFTEISQLISKINIHATLKIGNEADIAYFNEDQRPHLTDVTEPPMGGCSDKTIIVYNNIHNSKDSIETSTLSMHLQKDKFYSQSDLFSRAEKPKEQDTLRPGMTLKDRFILLEKLGQGGMGAVYKAKDMLKIEAQDKDPYVAIKVLTDAFKKNSGSFIALQREASKAQRLAHPNIATVYDFDRDSNTVFMTMEYLQGKPLNKLIEEIAKKPLKTNKALHIINELCSGLAYAHEKRLIHSDFKPGNCFLLSDGRVKLLDFGIARASTQNDEERENTIFDPAKLSAVTPAYATPEMFAGMNPDPRDDIYGLACVAYQLLAAGKHPYNKVAAPKIKELGIKPKSIKGLNRKQQRTLMKALTVTREERIATVEKFAEGMRSRKSHAKSIILGAIFVTIIVAGIGYKPFIEFRAEQALYDKIQLIKQGDKALMIETIWSLNHLNTEKRKIILVSLRREIITFYHDRVRSVFRPKEGLYDYPQASDLLLQAKKHYPDSVALSTIEDQTLEQKERLMNSLILLYNRYLNNKQLIKSVNGEDLMTVLPLIKRVDPKHYLLKETTLAELYLSEAEILITNRQYKDARKYIISGLKLFPDDNRLQNLDTQINAQFIN